MILRKLLPVILLAALAACVSSQIAEASVVVVKNDGPVLPVSDLESRTVVVVSVGDKAENVFSELCSRYTSVRTISIGASSDASSAIASLRKSDFVIVALFSHASWAKEVFNLMVAEADVAVFFMPPGDIVGFDSLGSVPAVLQADGSSSRQQQEAAMTIFGGLGVDAVLRAPVEGLAGKGDGCAVRKTRLGYCSPEQVGFDSRLQSRIDSVIAENIRQKSFPGCQVVVVKDGNVVVDKAYGTLSYAPGSPKVKRSTLYDVASMTKATATIAGLMSAYDDRLFRLDDPISKHIPQLKGTDKNAIPVRSLLYHTSGMPEVINTYSLMADPDSYTGKLISYKKVVPYTIKLDRNVWGNSKARMRADIVSRHRSAAYPIEIAKGLWAGEDLKNEVMQTIYTRPLGKKVYRYSCLNFCLLMQMEENLTSEPHDQWVARRVFKPIGAANAIFRPSRTVPVGSIAPTETDNFMRKQTLQGYVHDEIAAYSGGVQGNAGLFSNAGDIAKLCQTWLNGGCYGDKRIFSASTVKLFTESSDLDIKRGLGFDLAVRLKSLADIPGVSERVYGHTGFTGTCFYVDPDRNLIFVFLNNRVCPSRDNSAFSELMPRAALMEQIYRSLK